jgi:hypothetical protein
MTTPYLIMHYHLFNRARSLPPQLLSLLFGPSPPGHLHKATQLMNELPLTKDLIKDWVVSVHYPNWLKPITLIRCVICTHFIYIIIFNV